MSLERRIDFSVGDDTVRERDSSPSRDFQLENGESSSNILKKRKRGISRKLTYENGGNRRINVKENLKMAPKDTMQRPPLLISTQKMG